MKHRFLAFESVAKSVELWIRFFGRERAEAVAKDFLDALEGRRKSEAFVAALKTAWGG